MAVKGEGAGSQRADEETELGGSLGGGRGLFGLGFRGQ